MFPIADKKEEEEKFNAAANVVRHKQGRSWVRQPKAIQPEYVLPLLEYRFAQKNYNKIQKSNRKAQFGLID